MKRYLSGNQVCEKYGLNRIEFLQLVTEEGLQPYSPETGSPVECPHTMQGRLKGMGAALLGRPLFAVNRGL